MVLEQLFKKYRTVGLVGNPGEGKTSLALSELINLKKSFNIPVYVLGVEPSLFEYLERNGIGILQSKEDVLDLKIRDSVIFIDEFGDLFNIQSENKELEKVKRFFNRIDHLNDFVLLGSARNSFWNKFMNGLVRAFLTKKIEYDGLVNGTLLKRKIMAIVENTSEYRLDIPKNTYYVITDENLVEKKTFKYLRDIDSKIENENPFKKDDKKTEKNYGKKS